MTKIIDLSVKEKIYKSKKAQISILNDFRLEVAAGEKIAIVGESGYILVSWRNGEINGLALFFKSRHSLTL